MKKIIIIVFVSFLLTSCIGPGPREKRILPENSQFEKKENNQTQKTDQEVLYDLQSELDNLLQSAE